MKSSSYKKMDTCSFKIAAAIFSYWTVSTGMVFVNKQLVQLTPKDLSLFIVWFQCVFGALCLYLISQLSRNWNGNIGPSLYLHKHHLIQRDMIISSITFISALTFNSVLLKYISISFYQIARSLTIIFVIVLSAIVLQQKVGLRVLLACVLIILGFYIGVHEEIQQYGLQVVGVFYGGVTSFFSALSSTVCKKCQKENSVSSLQLTYIVFTIGCIILTPLVLVTSQLESALYLQVDQTYFWCLLFLSGLCCLLVGWISTLQITLTSPLTYIISTNSKSVIQTLLAVFWNKEAKNLFWWLGNVFVLSGIVLYAIFNHKESQKSDKERFIQKTNCSGIEKKR
ncbi:GDP-fucose transporter 1-like isoform X2 [Biomphalaria glabrata]|uniref:GDP-fucose transporter 1-like isoform X2 n=1 Tax=Biomphalaria glabrata TaxID=6526 RepID=A0A9W3AA78_BIOGL|nr:GDP-fucose transporter 1-like isoform X2 [Biomphalaria glabrata]